MEPKPCHTCGERPRKKGRSYCEPCDRARQRINNRIRAGWTEQEIVDAEVEQRVRETHEATRQAAIEAAVTQRLQSDPVARIPLPGGKGVKDDMWTDEEVAAFNAHFAGGDV